MRNLLLTLLVVSAPASAGITLFNQPGFTGNQHALTRASNNMSFTPRSVKVDGEAWELCPRPFFGGTCLRVDADRTNLNLPRAFSGTVRSARPAEKAKAEAAGEVKDDATGDATADKDKPKPKE
ncbi:beta/gamma crystallin-related protein [Sandaracinobacteroides hominis]|uniref:beta/gamma crystallin-related protein n=1 Tax=Sandaracinobacteroides hominis TaxID=2780086 RepID=UPI0018F49622|nr:beta/gamma crystallin-related protein [Sandaracinobacteroides hominis]